MIIKNYFYLVLNATTKKLGRGKSFRKKLFSTQRILEKNYPLKADFSFLQVGANDGKSFDFLYDFVIKRNVSGIVIEPIKEYYIELCENYMHQKEVYKINKAVHKSANYVSIYKIDQTKINLYPSWVKGIASFNLEHLTKFDFIKKEHILEEIVVAATLMEIVKEGGLKNFDYFQIDTEGYDFEILDMFDFTEYRPKLIKAEYVNLETSKKGAINKLLNRNKYYIFFEGIDIIGIDLNKLRL